jgi:hypothetical protein
MPYKPKFCCECGDKIDKTSWKFLDSRRFCKLCATDHTFDDWIPRISVVIAVLIGVCGLGMFLQKPEKPVNLVSSNSAIPAKIAANTQASGNTNVQTFAKIQEANSAIVQPPVKAQPIAQNPSLKSQKVENQSSQNEETIYFCGAETKKGTICTHKVKGGGRCWQHEGKPAMLPPEKLIASR